MVGCLLETDRTPARIFKVISACIVDGKSGKNKHYNCRDTARNVEMKKGDGDKEDEE